MLGEFFRLALQITRDHQKLMQAQTIKETCKALVPQSEYTPEDVEFMRHLGITLEDLR